MSSQNLKSICTTLFKALVEGKTDVQKLADMIVSAYAQGELVLFQRDSGGSLVLDEVSKQAIPVKITLGRQLMDATLEVFAIVAAETGSTVDADAEKYRILQGIVATASRAAFKRVGIKEWDEKPVEKISFSIRFDMPAAIVAKRIVDELGNAKATEILQNMQDLVKKAA